MTSEISAEEAAILAAAVIAYLGKESPTQKEQVEPAKASIDTERVEEITPNLKEAIVSIENRIKDLEIEIRALKNRIEYFDKGNRYVKKVEIAKSRSNWVLTSRREACNRVVRKKFMKFPSYWRRTDRLNELSEYF